MATMATRRDNGTGPAVLCAGMLISDLFVPPIQSLPAAGELIEVDGFLNDPGGCAANTAITLAQLGVRSAIAATVGDDDSGRQLRSILDDRGVDTSGVTRSALHTTARTVILTIQGEDRRYIHEVGANGDLTVVAIEAALGDARVLVIGGYFALPGLDLFELSALLRRARERGIITILDIVVPRAGIDAVAALRELLPSVDIFLPNLDEAATLTGEQDPRDQAVELLSWGCAAVIVTCGQDGAIYADRAAVLRVDPLEVETVDPSGAGDAFTGGLIVGLLEGWPTELSLRFAAAVGASACRGLGCTTSLFTREEALAVSSKVTLVELSRS